jgi:hypothetical protein
MTEPTHPVAIIAAEAPPRTPYELACETGFVGALELDENAAENSRHAVRAAIARKHGQAAE